MKLLSSISLVLAANIQIASSAFSASEPPQALWMDMACFNGPEADSSEAFDLSRSPTDRTAGTFKLVSPITLNDDLGTAVATIPAGDLVATIDDTGFDVRVLIDFSSYVTSADPRYQHGLMLDFAFPALKSPARFPTNGMFKLKATPELPTMIAPVFYDCEQR